MADDVFGDLGLATHRIDGDEGALELARFGELIEEIGNGGDLVGFFGHAELGQHERCIGGIGRKRVQRLTALATVMGAARRLAPGLRRGRLDRDTIGLSRPHGGDPVRDASGEHGGIDAVKEIT